MDSIALDASLAPFRMHSAVSLKQGILNEETCFVDVPNATSFKSVPSKAIREYKSTDPALFKMTGLAPAQKSSRVSYISDEANDLPDYREHQDTPDDDLPDYGEHQDTPGDVLDYRELQGTQFLINELMEYKAEMDETVADLGNLVDERNMMLTETDNAKREDILNNNAPSSQEIQESLEGNPSLDMYLKGASMLYQEAQEDEDDSVTPSQILELIQVTITAKRERIEELRVFVVNVLKRVQEIAEETSVNEDGAKEACYKAGKESSRSICGANEALSWARLVYHGLGLQ